MKDRYGDIVNGLLFAPQDSEDPNSEMVYHAAGFGAGGEFMACSTAFDNWDLNGIDLRNYPKPDKSQKYVTCEECISVLDANKFKKDKKGWFCAWK